MKKIKFEELIPAIITPMNKDSEIEYEGLKKNVEFYINIFGIDWRKFYLIIHGDSLSVEHFLIKSLILI